MADRIHRVTMFKLPNKEHQQKLVEAYKTLSATQQRDGKPYILSLVIGPAEENPRSKGFTFVSKTEFANLDDMRFYDQECPAHKVLKGLAGEFGVGPDDVLSVHYTPSHIALL